MTLKIVQHERNQHGWGISLVRYDDQGMPVDGFTLISKPTPSEQQKYVDQFYDFTGMEVQTLQGDMLKPAKLPSTPDGESSI